MIERANGRSCVLQRFLEGSLMGRYSNPTSPLWRGFEMRSWQRSFVLSRRGDGGKTAEFPGLPAVQHVFPVKTNPDTHKEVAA
jgi:hypothetical protein